MTIKERVQELMPELLQNLSELVSYPSVYSEDAKPFGQANINCLNHALELGKKYGFKAVNLDNYCGYIEIGEGKDIVGIVGHLDVVPVSDTWKTDPFTMTFKDGKYYGRGTSDDKGGVICGLMAMKILSEIKPDINKRIRLIMGCNEESGSACMKHYVKTEGPVSCGFTPDGSFPVVFGEKGMVFADFKGKTSKIKNISGGTAHNAVCAKVVIDLVSDSFDKHEFDAFVTGNGLRYEIECHDGFDRLTVFGTAAHASTPWEGVNAISFALEGLYQAGFDDEFTNMYHEKIGTGYYGEGLGVDLKDEYGRLTLNMGVASMENGEINVTIDIRFPVTMKHEPIIETLVKNGEGWVVNAKGADPLFFPLDHPMIQAMLKAYYDVTDSKLEPLTMGGGTYAREVPNIVAFGCDTQEYNWHIHDDNEFVTEESLRVQTEVYVQALLNLLEI